MNTTIKIAVSLIVLLASIATAPAGGGVTVSYQHYDGFSVARLTNSNPYTVRVEFTYRGTRMGVESGQPASGEDSTEVGARTFTDYGGHGISVTSLKITSVHRAD